MKIEEKTIIDNITNLWVEYIETFNDNTINVSDFRNKGYTLSEIEKIFLNAIENNHKISIEYY